MIGWWIRFTRALNRLVTGQSLQWRLALLTGLAVALSVILVGGATYTATRWSLLDQLDQELTFVARQVADTLAANAESEANGNQNGSSGLMPQSELTASNLAAANGLVAVVRADGVASQMQATEVAPTPDEIAVARLQSGSSARAWHDGDTAYRVVSVPLAASDGYYAVMFARPMTSLDATLGSLWLVLLVAGMLGVIATSGAALWTGRAVLAPVRRLSLAVKSVTQTDQLNPIRIYGRDDLGELTQSFNTMLKSLQQSREQQRQLIADAGHELRTPLTSMRTNIELLVADDKSGMLPEGARSEVLEDVSAQLGEFSALVGDLVALTRDDHLQRPHEFLDLAEVTESAIARARRRGPNIHFATSLDPTPVLGDPATLERAITNLLDNAVKFSPSEGTIHVVLHEGTLTIVDAGPGIDEADLPNIFDRFYRSDKARNTPGTGLGLAIVAHTATAHGGSVKASNAPDAGAKFTFKIPLAELPEEFLE